MPCFPSRSDSVNYNQLPFYTKLFCFCIDRSSSLHKSLDLDDTFYYRPRFIGNNILFFGRKNSRFPYQCLLGNDWPLNFLSFLLIVACTLLADYYIIQHYHFAFLIGSSLLLASTLWFFCFTSFSDPGIIFKEPVPLAQPCSSPLSHDEKHSHTINTRDGLIPSQPTADPSGSSCAEPAVSHYMPTNCTNQNTQTGVFSCLISGTLDETVYDDAYLLECGHCEIIRPAKALHCPSCGFCINELDHHCPWTGKCIGKKTLKHFQAFLCSLFLLFFYLLAFFTLYIIKRF